MNKENNNPLSKETEEAVIRSLPTPKFVDTSKEEAVILDATSTSADTVETGTESAIFCDEFAMNKENSNPMSKETDQEDVIRSLPTPKFVDTSKEEAVILDAASTSADTVETGTQTAMIFWDDEDDDWIQRMDLTASPPQAVVPAVNPCLEFLMAGAPPGVAAVLHAARTNIFNVGGGGAHVNAYYYNHFSAQARSEASATARARAPVVNSTIFQGSTEEEDGNDWYESIARDAQRLEQMEEPEIDEMSSPLRPPKEKEDHYGQKRPSAGEDEPELTLEDYCKIWGIHSSQLDPDEPGPSSTKRQSRVSPLVDDEVAKFDCGICLETLPILDLFHGMECGHKFCAQCMTTYIEDRIRDGGVSILCPDPACKDAAAGEGNNNNGGVLNPEHCKKSIDYAAFCSWGDRLTEKAIPPDQQVYCPNPRCGLMFERTLGDNDSKQAPCKASCPACNHLMCTACGLGWVIDGRDDDHHNCDEGKGTALVKELAAAHSWKQCPSCKIMVERIMGCNTMHCRCGCLFCYSCGGRMMDGAGRDDGGAELCQCRQNVIYVPVRDVARGQVGETAQAFINRFNH